MNTRIKISVTPDDIRKGERYNGSSCPIGRALQRALPDKKVHANITQVRVWDTDEAWKDEVIGGSHRVSMVGLPTKAMRVFIENFDQGYPVEPATFYVTLLSV